MKAKRIAICLSLIGVVPAFAQNARISLWRSDDLTLRMEARGADRTLLIEKLPPAKAKALGIAPGAAIWEGQRKGDQLVGEAISYKTGCPALRYEARGNARLDRQGRLILSGMEPARVAGGCERGPTASDRPRKWTLTLQGKPTEFHDDE